MSAVVPCIINAVLRTRAFDPNFAHDRSSNRE